MDVEMLHASLASSVMITTSFGKANNIYLNLTGKEGCFHLDVDMPLSLATPFPRYSTSTLPY
jgi:hypothetical protein